MFSICTSKSPLLLLLIASDEIWYIERGSFVFNGLISIQWALAEDDRKRGYRYVEPGLFAMHILFDANVLRRRRGLNFVDVDVFYNDVLNESWSLRDDYLRFVNSRMSFISFPFVLMPANKAKILKVENQQQMRQEFEQAFLQHLLRGVDEVPYLILNVDRHNIIQDTLQQIQLKENKDLRKPLKVKFRGEPGVDEGGLRKEFFMLLVKELFDPKYGIVM